MAGRRTERVAGLLATLLTELLRRDLGDPRLGALVVTRSRATDDLSLVRVWVRLLVGDEDPAKRSAALHALRAATPRIRRGLAPRLGLRRLPELRFEYDTGHDATRRVEELLAEIAADAPPAGNDEPQH